MFDPGTKVILLGSSHHGKSGPKRGSVGYYSFSSGNGYVQIDKSIYACEMCMYFIRYGYEQKSRCERKKVMAIFPFPTINNLTETGSTIVKATCKRAIKESKVNGIPTVVAAPIIHSGTNLLDEKYRMELMAWTKSLLSSHDLSRFTLHAFRQNTTRKYAIKPLDNMALWIELREMFFNKDAAAHHLRKMASSEDARSCIYNLLKALLISSKQRHIKQVWPGIEREIYRTPAGEPRDSVTLRLLSHILPIVNGRFIDSLDINDWSVGNASQAHAKMLIKHLDTTRKILRGLSVPTYNGIQVFK